MKNLTHVITVFFAICILSSCATVFGGKVNNYQRTKPLPGQPQRPLRVAAFVCDVVLFWPGAIIDFATGAIYRPHPVSEETKPATPIAETKTSK